MKILFKQVNTYIWLYKATGNKYYLVEVRKLLTLIGSEREKFYKRRHINARLRNWIKCA